jgi:hypothetical protein
MKATVQVVAVMLLLGSLAAGCAGTTPGSSFKTSGFLGDYTRLAAADASGAVHSFRNPNADLSGYNKLLFEPVTVWKAAASTAGDLPRSDLRRLAKIFRLSLERGFRVQLQNCRCARASRDAHPRRDL